MPDRIYYQVDGGSENTAKVMYGIAELLVAKGIVVNLLITRLPVGHSHEDIDSKFSLIWKEVWKKHVNTVQDYKEIIETALNGNNQGKTCEVIDIFCIPDFESVISECMDSHFGRYAKLQWTQLQWRFQRVPISTNFPLGVKTTYRAFCQDEVWEIIKDSEKRVGFSGRVCKVQWFPEEDKERNIPEGLYLLQRFPDLEIKPEAFIPDSRAKLENTVRKIIGHFSPMEVGDCDASVIRPSDLIDEKKFGDEIIAKWIDFAENRAPLNDDTEDYSRQHQLHIPLFDKLFAPSASVIVRNTSKTPVQN
jgi:hypothetical protein